MIRYRLQCKKKHEFEAWFGSSTAYDEQAERGQVVCPECGSTKVSKTLMKPGVATRDKSERPTRSDRSERAESERAESERAESGRAESGRAEQVPVAVPTDKQTEMQRQFLTMLQNVRREVEKNAEYVGPSFAEEARKIHLEEVEARSIWGEATIEEARDLIEDGIECLPLPRLPKDSN